MDPSAAAAATAPSGVPSSSPIPMLPPLINAAQPHSHAVAAAVAASASASHSSAMFAPTGPPTALPPDMSAAASSSSSSSLSASAAADKKRDAVLWDMSLSWPAAFGAWHAGLQRERLLSAPRHAELVRLLAGGAAEPKRQGQLRAAQRAGYFVVQGADGRQQLYIRLQLHQLPGGGAGGGKAAKATKGKGKSKAAAAAAEAAAAAAEAADAEGDASGSSLAPAGPLLVADGSDPAAVSAAWEARAAAAAAVAAAQVAAAGSSALVAPNWILGPSSSSTASATAAATTAAATAASVTGSTAVRMVLSAAQVPAEMSRMHDASHAGSRTLYLELSSRFHAIPRIACEALVARCPQCRAKAARLTRAQQLMQQTDVNGGVEAAAAAVAAAAAAASGSSMIMKPEDAASSISSAAHFPFALHPSFTSMLLKRPAATAGLDGSGSGAAGYGYGYGYGMSGAGGSNASGTPSVAEVLAAAATANGTLPITKRQRYAGLDGATAVAMSAYLASSHGVAASNVMAAPQMFMPMPAALPPAVPSSSNNNGSAPALLLPVDSASGMDAVLMPAALSQYWSSELRGPLSARLLRLHPPSSPAAVSDVLLASTVHRRALPITPLALEEVSRALLELLQRVLMALEQQMRGHALSGRSGELQAWLVAGLGRMTGDSLLGHRMERDARRSIIQQSQEDTAASMSHSSRSATAAALSSSPTGAAAAAAAAASASQSTPESHPTISPTLLRFVVRQLLQHADLRLLWPHVAAQLQSPSAGVFAHTLSTFLSSVLGACADELLDVGGWVARRQRALALQSCHLLECVSSHGDLRALWTRALLPLFSSLPVADIDQIWPTSSDADAQADKVKGEEREEASSGGGPKQQQQQRWWSTGGEPTEARMEAALDCITRPESGGYPDTFVRYGIVPLRRRICAASSEGNEEEEEEESMDVAAQPSALDEQAHHTRFTAFSAAHAVGIATPSVSASSSRPSAISLSLQRGQAGQRRVIADVEVVDGTGDVLPLRIDYPTVGPRGRSPAAAVASAVGLVTHRGTGCVVAEIYSSTPSAAEGSNQQQQLMLLLENTPSSTAYVPPDSLPSDAEEEQSPRGNSTAAMTQSATLPLIQCRVRMAADEQSGGAVAPFLSPAASSSSVPPPPLARVLRRALELALEGAEDEQLESGATASSAGGGSSTGRALSSTCWSSSQPLPLRVELRLRLLQRDGVAALEHPLARRPDLLRIVAEYDPAYLPHDDHSLPKLLQQRRPTRASTAGHGAGAASR